MEGCCRASRSGRGEDGFNEKEFTCVSTRHEISRVHTESTDPRFGGSSGRKYGGSHNIRVATLTFSVGCSIFRVP